MRGFILITSFIYLYSFSFHKVFEVVHKLEKVLSVLRVINSLVWLENGLHDGTSKFEENSSGCAHEDLCAMLGG